METKGQHSLDDLFRRGFENEESTPPSAAWAQMESLLDAQQSGGEDKKKRRVVAWYWVAAAVVLPFLLAGFWWIKSGNGEQQLAKTPTPSVMEQSKVETTAATSSTETTASTASKTEAVIQKDGFENTKPVTANGMVAVASEVKAQKVIASKSVIKSSLPETIQIADNQYESTSLIQSEKQVVSSKQPIAQQVDPPKPVALNVVAQTAEQSQEDDEIEIASIEYRSSSKTIEGLEVASVEWKKENRVKRSFGKLITRIKAGDIGKLPTLADARENIVAILGFK